jgi:hypothetical protein
MIKNVIGNCLLVIITLIFSAELFSFIAVKAKLLLFNDTPGSYLWQASGYRWRTQVEPWGAWHRINAFDHHRNDCIDATYQSNNVGARDNDFSIIKRDPRPRYLLLGDSFAEGWGVNIEDTAQAKLEKSLGIDVYNFGVGGWVGPVQYYLIYKNLASKFDHDGIILFFLPANDFFDNDFEVKGKAHPTWYRPYYRKNNDNDTTFDIMYSPAAVIEDNYYGDPAKPSALIRFLLKYTYTSNTLRTINHLRGNLALKYTDVSNTAGTIQHIRDNLAEAFGYSGYYDATPVQQRAAIYFIEKIIDQNKGKKTIILIIPKSDDIIRMRSTGKAYTDQYWYQAFISIAKSKPNVDVIDMMSSMPQDYERLFLKCDGHWTAAGNQVAANLIASRLQISGAGAEVVQGGFFAPLAPLHDFIK